MRIITLVFTILLISFPAFPWGAVGHETIAYIAEQNLSPETLAKIKPLLGGKSIEEAAIWADQYKESHRTTAPWHYLSLPVRAKLVAGKISAYKSQRKGNNVLNQLQKDIEVLKNPGLAVADRQKALWFIIHFVGDLHMPLYVADDNDAGGNGKIVRFFTPTVASKGRSAVSRGQVTNLRSLWDNLIEIKATEDPKQLGAALQKKIKPADRWEWQQGTIESWTFESYAVAKTEIYPGVGTDNSSLTVLKRDYYQKMRPTMEVQLEKAGVRLAALLENIFEVLD